MAEVRMVTPQGNYFTVPEEEVEHWEEQGYEQAPLESGEEKPKKKTTRKSRAKKTEEAEEENPEE